MANFLTKYDEEEEKRQRIFSNLVNGLTGSSNQTFLPTPERIADNAYATKKEQSLPVPTTTNKTYTMPTRNNVPRLSGGMEAKKSYDLPTYEDSSYRIAQSRTEPKKDIWERVRDKETELGDKFRNSSLGKAWDNVANSGIGKFVDRIGDNAANMVTAGTSKIDTQSTGNKATDFVADILGNGLGMVTNPANMGSYNQILRPFGNVAEKGVSKLTQNAPKLAKNLLPTITREGVEQAIQEGVNTNINDGSLEDTLKASGRGLLQGALFGGAVKGASDTLPMLKNAVTKTNMYEDGIKNPTGNLQPIKPRLDENIIKNPMDKPSLETPVLNETMQDRPIASIKNKPVIEPLSAKAEIASTINSDFRESRFKDGGTLRKSPIVADEASQKLINEINMEYEVKPNAQSVNRATKELETNFDGVVERIRNSETLNSAEDTVASGLITRQLRQKAEETGDYTNLKSWLEEIQPKVTSTAQSLQALRTWQDMTPDGVLLKAQQVVGKVNREGEKVFGKDFKPVDLTTDEMKYISDTMTKIQTMADGRSKDVEFAKVKKVISDKIPSTLAEKVAGLQRISLLLNPKTMSRNVVGNVVMGGLEGLKDFPATAIDKALSVKTGQRTTKLPDLKTLGKGFVKGTKETIQDARLGIDTSPSSGQFELPDKEIFNNKTLKKLDKYTKVGLQLGDRPFYQAYYDDSLRQQMQLSKSDKPTEKMIENAKKVAEDRTFQNDSAMVQGFKRLQKGLNDIGEKFGVGSSKFGIGNFAIPFTKTPANILDKAIDYTPLGTISSIKQSFKIGSKDFDQKKFVDTVGRNIVGTAAIALGYDLAKEGLLTGGSNKDKDVSSLERQAGKLPYAFKVGDKYITYDFAQPAAIPLAIGADIYHQGKNRKEAGNVAVEALKSGGTTLFNQSLLQGMQRLFGGYSPMDGIAQTIGNIPTQFIPTSFKQVNQLIDPNIKDIYSPSKKDQKANEIKTKLPILSQSLPNKVDTLGNDVKSFDGKNNVFNVLFNPSYTSTYNPSKAEEVALEIYENTGNTSHFPRVAKDKITYKENKDTSKTISLTPSEKTELQKYIGKETNSAYEEYGRNSTWREKDDKEKIKDLQRHLTEIYNKGEELILKGRGINEYKR